MKSVAVFLFLISMPLYGQFNPNSFQQFIKDEPLIGSHVSNDVVQEFPEFSSIVNWTKGMVVTQYRVPITYTDPNIGRNIVNLTEKLKKEMLEYVISTVQKVQVSSVFFVKDYFLRDNKIQTGLLSSLYALPVKNPVISGSHITGTMNFPLYGMNSVSQPFYENIREIQSTNYLKQETVDTVSYDTLIIDMVMFNQFKPSLMTRILDQDNNVVHCVATVYRNILQKQGSVSFVSSITEALNHKTRGNKVAYILPTKVSGAMNGDIVLFNEDVKKIFSQKRSLESFKKGNVIVIVPSNKSL